MPGMNNRWMIVATTLCLASTAPALATTNALGARVNEAFSLRASAIAPIEHTWRHGEPLVVVVPIDDHPFALHLEPWSVRDAGFALLEERADGSLIRVDPGPERTLRGTVVGLDGATVAASVLEDGLYAMIRFGDGATTWIEPIAGRVEGMAAAAHVVYNESDVLEEGGGTCMALANPLFQGAHHGAGGSVIDGTLCTTQLACDADYEYYLDYGSSAAVADRIGSVVNTMNVQYERDVEITHVLTTIIVRTSPSDPYSSTDAVTLLNQFRNHWNASQGSVVRDVAQLFTGKEIDGGTIGIAWLNAVCTSYGYGVVQSDFNGNFSCATDLSAHELGHNWGADHCQCTSYTMNPYITCANRFSSVFSIPEIAAFRDSRPCLDCGTPPPATGACCVETNCTVVAEADCDASGGVYQGDGTDCSGDPCAPPPPAMGGCCIGVACFLETEADCALQGGTYLGDGTDCGGDPCGGDPVDAALTSYQVTTGTPLGGGLADLGASDEARATVRSETSGRKRSSAVEITAGQGLSGVSTITLDVEAAASVNQVKLKVELLRSNGRWRRVASYSLGTSDLIRTTVVADAGQYVVNGEISIRLTSEKRNGTHDVAYDLVRVSVE